MRGFRCYLELLLQLLPQRAQLVRALVQVHVAVELDEGLDEDNETYLDVCILCSSVSPSSVSYLTVSLTNNLHVYPLSLPSLLVLFSLVLSALVFTCR